MSDSRSTTPQLETYYSKRAREYELIYEKPERQHELEWLRARVPELYRGRTVLEVACGTGYWTQYIAPAAHRIYACDINEAVLEIAREKRIPASRSTFFKADAVTLEGVPRGCNAAFAGFWWSHVKKSSPTSPRSSSRARWSVSSTIPLPPEARPRSRAPTPRATPIRCARSPAASPTRC